MRGVLILLLAISLIAAVEASPYPKITGSSLIDAAATSGSSILSIFVDADKPNVSIITPTNNQNIYGNTSILLLAQFADNYLLGSAYYNIDNGTNTTLTLNSTNGTSTTFSSPVGTHRLYVYVNDSVNNINSSSVSINSDYNYTFTNFTIKFDGATTNLSSYNTNNLTFHSLTNFTIEKVSKGRIVFLVSVNLTNSTIANLDLSLINNVNISQNRVEVNSSAFSGLNKTANITLYNLSFSDPRILKDGGACPSTVCSNLTYSGGNLTFTVTEFSVYSAEETPSGAASDSAYTGEGPIKYKPKTGAEEEEEPVIPEQDEFGKKKTSSFLDLFYRKEKSEDQQVSLEQEKKEPIIQYPEEVTLPIRNTLSVIMISALILALLMIYPFMKIKSGQR